MQRKQMRFKHSTRIAGVIFLLSWMSLDSPGTIIPMIAGALSGAFLAMSGYVNGVFDIPYSDQ